MDKILGNSQRRKQRSFSKLKTNHMKKLLTICLLLATTFTVKAQDMSFEETVKYINDKIACCSEHKTVSITAKNDGTISFRGSAYNFFDLVNSKSGVIRDLPDSNGIHMFYNEPSATYGLSFNVSSSNTQVLVRFANKKDAERIYNALQHLRSLCKKEKDSFDN